MNPLSLTPRQRHQLEHQLHSTPDARLYRRTLAILEISRGQSIVKVAQTLGVHPRSVYYWVRAYAETHHPLILQDKPRSGRPRLWTDPYSQLLQMLLRQSPQQRDYWAVEWTVPLLRQELQQMSGQWFAEDTIRRELQRLGYVWKRSRYRLAPDPQREKKTPYPVPDQGFTPSNRSDRLR